MQQRSNNLLNMNFFLLIIIMTIIFQSKSLKLHSQYQHFKTNYFHYLTNSSTSTASMAINYTQQIVKINSNFSIAADINNRIIKVQRDYLGHEQQVLLLADFNYTFIQTTNYVCKQPSQNIKQALQYRTSDMIQYLQNSILKVNFIQNQQAKGKAKTRLQNQIVYLQGLEKLLKQKCKSAIKLSKTTYISNPNGKNWILGNWTYDQFIDSYINTINSNPNTTKCPIDRPYFSNNQCINCQLPNDVFNMKDGVCSSCEYGRIVNIKTRKCVSQINYVSNLMDTHHPWITKQGNLKLIIQKFNKQKSAPSAVVCPFETPFLLSQECSVCPQSYVYLIEEKKCQMIPFNMTYDPNIHEIVKQLDKYQTNSNISGQKPTTNLKSCPSEIPYFDTITCIQCYTPFYFSNSQKNCVQCPDKNNCPPKALPLNPQNNTNPSNTSKRYVTNSLAKNVTGKSTDQVLKYWDKMAYQLNDFDNCQQCPIQTPFYQTSTKSCIKCQRQSPLFNISTDKCTSCSSTQTFNIQTYLCQSKSLEAKKVNIKATNIWAENFTDFVAKQNKSNGQECPLTTPYTNGSSCFNCKQTEVFNSTTLKCSNCSVGTTFNSSTHSCNGLTQKKTFTQSTNLWIANLTEYQKKQNLSKAEQCSKDKPFSNGTNCISCKVTEIFNTSSLNCSICPNGTIYNYTNFTCVVGKPEIFMPGKTTRLIGTPNNTPSNYTNFFKNLNQSQYNVQNCSSTQYSTKTGCITCKDTQYFCVECLICKNCTNIDQNGVCTDNITFLTNTTNLDKFVGVKNGDVTTYSSNQTKLIQAEPDKFMICGQAKPFSINKTCSSCSDIFNVSSLSCTSCPAGQKYDSSQRICYTPAFQAISNLSFGVPPYYTSNQTKIIQEYQKAKQAGVKICSQTTPFFNGSACIKCQATYEYFNLDTKKCQNCPKGKKYDSKSFKCLDDPPKFYTSLSSSNLLFDGQPYNYYKQKEDQYKNAGAKQCDISTPYASQSGCIKCATDKPYFSLYDLTCKACPIDFQYNANDHECQDKNGDFSNQPQATIQKSLANLFT